MPATAIRRRYLQNVRVVRTYFAALVGYGLIGIAQGDPFGADSFPCFIVAVCVYLRLLFGSAHHLWVQYGENGEAGDAPNMFRDLAFLTLYGVITVLATHRDTVAEFLLWIALVPLASLTWDMWARSAGRIGRWTAWLLLDATEASFLLLIALVPSSPSGALTAFGWGPQATLAAVVTMLICFFDFVWHTARA